MTAPHWSQGVHQAFATHRVGMVPYVPDGGQARLIDLCIADTGMRPVMLTTEEEGIALAAGAFLGGQRSALLMQSSGVGNCVNMLSLPRVCHMPLFMLVTMRGEWGEFNPWQVPMGQSTQAVLETAGVIVHRVDHIDDVVTTVDHGLRLAFASRCRVAVLLSQRLIGTKDFARGDK